jgi:hypothetical protein
LGAVSIGYIPLMAIVNGENPDKPWAFGLACWQTVTTCYNVRIHQENLDLTRKTNWDIHQQRGGGLNKTQWVLHQPKWSKKHGLLPYTN